MELTGMLLKGETTFPDKPGGNQTTLPVSSKEKINFVVYVLNGVKNAVCKLKNLQAILYLKETSN